MISPDPPVREGPSRLDVSAQDDGRHDGEVENCELEIPMLNLILYLIALLTGMLALSGVGGAVGGTMMTFFQVSLILLAMSLLTRGFRRNIMLY